MAAGDIAGGGVADLLVRFPDEAALLAAARAVRACGATRIEAFTPYHVEELDEVIGAPRSRLARVAAAGAVAGGVIAYALQWLLAAYLYPIETGARPPHMPFAYGPITLEMAFLGAGLSVFAAVLWRAGLVRLWTPVFEVDGFASATRDGFWLAVAGDDPRVAEARAALQARAA